MLVIDENKLRLLKMKEKLLEVSSGNHDDILSQYKEIILDIDKIMYDKLINMIRDTNYHNQSLEEQLEFLTTLVNEYNSFNEFQCRYKNVYEKYAVDKLELTSIEDIYIDRIKEKIDAINGYLINSQNLLRHRNNLEELNVQLIDAEKKKREIEDRFNLLEEELRKNVLNAEGRIDNHGNLEYSSIVKEFENYGLNFGKLLDDGNLLKQELEDTKSAIVSEEDKMEAARVCFNTMPTIDSKKMYNICYFDLLHVNYKLILLNFASLMARKCSDYDGVKGKRVEIKSLLKERSKYLTDLGIKYVIDPFGRIKLDNQLEIIELLGKNLQSVLLIKGKIKDTFNLVDDLNRKNDELYSIISKQVELFNNRYSVIDVVGDIDVSVEHEQINDNKIINIRDISSNLNLSLIRGKTDGVISRVYELFNNVPVTVTSEDVVPELVIQKDDVFAGEPDIQEIFDDNASNTAIFTDTEDVFENASTNVSDSVFMDESSSQGIFADSNSSTNDELFSEVEPFKETVLFTNKYDDVFAGNKKDDEMPELFFESDAKVFDDKVEDDSSSELSLDEQIKALKLVA